MSADGILRFLDAKGPADVPFSNTTKVVAVDGQLHGDRERTRATEHSGNHEPPVIPLAFVPESQKPEGVPQCPDMVEIKIKPPPFIRSKLPEEGGDTGIILPGGVNGSQYILVAVNERLVVHTRDKIAFHIAAVKAPDDAVLLFQALIQTRAGGSIEKADHGGNDAAVLDEVYLTPEYGKGVAIKADNEAALHLEAGVVELFNSGRHITVAVLVLGALLEAVLIGGLNTDKDGIETGLHHQPNQLIVVSEVNRRFCVEVEGVPFTLPPFNNGGQDFRLEFFPVAYEIIVDDKDAVAPALLIEGVQLSQQLGGVLGAWPVTVENGDITELTVEGTAAGILDVHGRVVLHVDERPERQGCFGDIGIHTGPVKTAGTTIKKVVKKRRQDSLSLT